MSVVFDRFLFAFTIASHIVLVTMSIALILLIFFLEYRYLTKKEEIIKDLIKRLKKVFIVSFGIGTASGVVVAVELINLFPGFMTLVSETGVIAIFYAEVFAFFLETILLMIYVYFDGVFKWKYTNIVLSFFVSVGTITSGILITMVNAWMNSPNGFDITSYKDNGIVTGVNPWAPFLTSTTIPEELHVIITTIFTGMMIIASYFVYKYLQSNNEKEKSAYKYVIKISSWINIITILLAGITGSNEISTTLQQQPLKYAAFELNTNPGKALPEILFGTYSNGKVVNGIPIPGLQGFLAQMSTGDTYLPGLSQYPSSEWPPLYVHLTFDSMVVGGVLLGLLLFMIFIYNLMKKDFLKNKFIAYLQIIAGPIALIVYELGWVTDEVGRVPWIVYNVLTIQQAANNSSGVYLPGYFIIAFYIVLIPSTFYIFSRIFNAKPIKEVNKP